MEQTTKFKVIVKYEGQIMELPHHGQFHGIWGDFDLSGFHCSDADGCPELTPLDYESVSIFRIDNAEGVEFIDTKSEESIKEYFKTP
jgi:hypothetical protein